MKHVVNEGGSHIRSFLDAMIAESSVLTVSLRTLGGLEVKEYSIQLTKKMTKNPLCVEGGGGGGGSPI